MTASDPQTDPIRIEQSPDPADVHQTAGTPIQEFYKDANVFITGSTGFLGRILLEKLLRSCPDISTVYLLVRNKKGKDLHTRVDEIFDDVVFDKLRKECPKFRHKIVGVGGDCSLPNLGLSEQDTKILMKEINVIFHVAATVRFNEKLKMAVTINIRATQDILRLAHQMPNLKALMHVSTAFSNCTNEVVEEKIYPPPMGYKELILMTEKLPDKLLEDITSRILEKYPNTYAFTKQIAEDVVRQEASGLPAGILRPSIVVSTYKEPIPAWINNMYGATGVAAGAGVGLLRAMHCDPDCNANIVPVDMCVNALIGAAWEVSKTHQEAKKSDAEFSIPVYHYESSNENPIDWKTFMEKSTKYGILTPSYRAVWYYSLTLYKSYLAYIIAVFILHVIPALVVDAALLCIGKSPRMTKIYTKVHNFSSVVTYFATRQWVFKSSNVRKLIATMCERDRRIFFCDLKELEWEVFFQLYLSGVRVYLIQDPLETLPEARKRWNRLYWAHQTVKAVAGFLLLRILWSVCTFLYNLIL